MYSSFVMVRVTSSAIYGQGVKPHTIDTVRIHCRRIYPQTSDLIFVRLYVLIIHLIIFVVFQHAAICVEYVP